MAKTGISTACFYPLETETSLEQAAQAGIRDFEVHFSTFSELSDKYLKELRKMLRHYGGQVCAAGAQFNRSEIGQIAQKWILFGRHLWLF